MTSLNKAQQAAVMAGDGPVLVLAGAGAGKTRVLVERLAWLIEERGVNPRSLLALTFTNRAAREMRERVSARLSAASSGGSSELPLWTGTFHSFGAYLLRREIQSIGRSAQFVIYDDADQLSLMKRLVRDLPSGCGKISPRDALSWISRLKQDLKTPGDVAAHHIQEQDRARKWLWDQYAEALKAASALDFDDLLVLSVRVLEKDASVKERYQRRFRYVLVDEYQDTNQAQHRMAHLLTEQHRNLFVVGDEDQSIYSWRGARIRNILEFEKQYPGAQVYRLEQNYRSTGSILFVANALIGHNQGRMGKKLWTEETGGEAVRFYHAFNAEDEASFVVDDLVESGVPPERAAVLYRTNGQARVLEEALRRKGIRYVVVGGVQFYARKEVKDLLAYLRLLVNPTDDEALRRVLNVPPRGIGASSLERIEEYATQREVPLLQVLRDIEHDHTFLARARESSVAFVQMIDALALRAKTEPVLKVVEALIEQSRYREFIAAIDEKEARSRLEIIDEFLASCKEFDRRAGSGAGASGSVLQFLQEIALYSEADEQEADDQGAAKTGALTLMTCHGAKGLEFDSVYLIGLEEGLLPHSLSTDSDQDVEEERRLCYVAMTRARKRLTLTAAGSRVLYGEASDDRELSRFVRELPLDRITNVRRASKKEEGARPERRATPSPGGRGSSGMRPSYGGRPVGSVRPVPLQGIPAERVSADYAPAQDGAGSGGFRYGARVRHPKFGEGSVMFTQGSGDGLKVRVRFKTGRTALFLVKVAGLEILEGRDR